MSAPLSVPTFLREHLQDSALYPDADSFTLFELAKGLAAGTAIIKLDKKARWAAIIYYDPQEVSVKPEYFKATTQAGLGSNWGKINGLWQHLVLNDEADREVGLVILYGDLCNKKAFAAARVFFTLHDSRQRFNQYPELLDV